MTDTDAGRSGMEELAGEAERDIRIAIWNAAMNGGIGQDPSQAFIQRAMAEPTMLRALHAIGETERYKAAYEALRAELGATLEANERLLGSVLAAIDTGRSEPLFIVRDLLRNRLEDRDLQNQGNPSTGKGAEG